jgi:hypothetical protein
MSRTKEESVTVIDYGCASDNLGVSLRRHRPGPEADLVAWFLEEKPIRLPPGCRATIFREPRIESGFPDLVVVIWNHAVAKRWRPSRAKLTTRDIRVMHYLAEMGPTPETDLRTLFSRGVGSGLSRLEEAGMVRPAKGRWKARSLSTCFAARQIVAIEAKVNEWASALLQASLNTWFASGSYVLLPQGPKRRTALAEAEALGVGVWARGTACLDGTRAHGSRLPRSYASWLFNEWAWRAAFGEGTRQGESDGDRLAAGCLP